MPRAAEPSDDDVRQRFARVFGVSLDSIRAEPVDLLRAHLESVDEQLDTYVALDFMTEAEAKRAGAR